MDANIAGARSELSNAPIIAPGTVQATPEATGHQLQEATIQQLAVNNAPDTPAEPYANRIRQPHRRLMSPNAVEAIANANPHVNNNWTQEQENLEKFLSNTSWR